VPRRRVEAAVAPLLEPPAPPKPVAIAPLVASVRFALPEMRPPGRRGPPV